MSAYLDQNSLRRYLHDLSSESACLKYEWKRLGTLKDLPKENSHWVTRLARDGFFCDDETDEIRCHFCGFIISNNDDSINKTDEHKKSACPIFTDQNCDNVPIRCAYESMEVMADLNTVEANGRNMPKYPEYKDFEKRHESFVGLNSQDRRYYHRLAMKGFFNYGARLSARCHYCGFNLMYDPSIDPFEAHAALFGNCGFLQQEKGMEFVERHKERHERHILSQLRNAQEVTARAHCHCDEDEGQMPQTSSSNSKFESVKQQPEFPSYNSQGTGARPKNHASRFHANEESSNIQGSKNKRACEICIEKEVQILFCPCGHLVTCENCAEQCTNCVVCKREITKRVKCFLS